jgi:ribosome-associated protein
VTPEELKERISTSEFSFLTSRSSGPGGQNVNKVSTKVEAHFNFKHSMSLSDREKELISENLRSRINSDGELIVKSQSERSQLRNRNKAIERIFILLSGALTEKPERKPTAPTKKSRVERLAEKRRRGQLKNMRKDDNSSGEDLTPP